LIPSPPFQKAIVGHGGDSVEKKKSKSHRPFNKIGGATTRDHCITW